MISFEDEFNGLAPYIPNEEERKILLRFRRGLTPYGFELFIAKYFEHKEWYKTNTTEEFDKDCVDVEGSKENEEILIQCKLWQTFTQNYSIKIKDVREFFWAIQYRMHENIRLVYITTTWISPNAIDFCRKNNIEIWDYKKIIEILKIYSFNNFLNFIIYNKEQYSYKEIFEKNVIEYINEEKWIKKEKIIKEIKEDIKIEKEKIIKQKIKIFSLSNIEIIFFKKLIIYGSIITIIISVMLTIYQQNKSQNITPQIKTNIIENKSEVHIFKNTKRNIPKNR